MSFEPGRVALGGPHHHVGAILRKLGVRTRAQASAYCRRLLELLPDETRRPAAVEAYFDPLPQFAAA